MNSQARILILGCGGVGTEVIKLLRNYNLTVLDFDKIELSNLNRQFFYTDKDRGCYKSQVVSEKINCSYLISKVDEIEPEFLNNFEVVFCCLDNIYSRMEANSIFMKSTCELLIDCGVEGMQMHVKRVGPGDACLYCIKDLYVDAFNMEVYLCSMKYPESVTGLNRTKILAGMIQGGESIDCIVDRFNAQVSIEELKTTYFEVQGLLERIIPNVCVINSICASYAVAMMYDQECDYVYYNGMETPVITKLKIDSCCFICRDHSKII